MRIKTGLGQDSHRFQTKPTDKPLILAGVVFENHLALAGNSDADVVFHAITNAVSSISGINVLGAKADELCQQGISDSRVYLKHALTTLTNWRIEHITLSIECATPTITPYIEQMKASIANVVNISTADVGITATSGDKLSAFGRAEGIQVFSIITVSQ